MMNCKRVILLEKFIERFFNLSKLFLKLFMKTIYFVVQGSKMGHPYQRTVLLLDKQFQNQATFLIWYEISNAT